MNGGGPGAPCAEEALTDAGGRGFTTLSAFTNAFSRALTLRELTAGSFTAMFAFPAGSQEETHTLRWESLGTPLARGLALLAPPSGLGPALSHPPAPSTGRGAARSGSALAAHHLTITQDVPILQMRTSRRQRRLVHWLPFLSAYWTQACALGKGMLCGASVTGLRQQQHPCFLGTGLGAFRQFWVDSP